MFRITWPYKLICIFSSTEYPRGLNGEVVIYYSGRRQKINETWMEKGKSSKNETHEIILNYIARIIVSSIT
jgi:hypothetical protein